MSHLIESFPAAHIVLLTPIHRGYATFGAGNVQPDESDAILESPAPPHFKLEKQTSFVRHKAELAPRLLINFYLARSSSSIFLSILRPQISMYSASGRPESTKPNGPS